MRNSLILVACLLALPALAGDAPVSVPGLPFSIGGMYIEDITTPLAPGETPADVTCGPVGQRICWDGCSARATGGVQLLMASCRYAQDAGGTWTRYCSCLFNPTTPFACWSSFRGCQRGPTVWGPM
jgi:hypothetical protein